MPRMTALHMLRSTMKTVSAPASSSFRGSLPHPTQPLCTLRVRRHRRLTQHSLPGGLLGLTWAGLAPADRASFAGAFLHSITSSAGRAALAARRCRAPAAVCRLMTNSNLVGCIDRQLRWLLALEDTAGIVAGLTKWHPQCSIRSLSVRRPRQSRGARRSSAVAWRAANVASCTRRFVNNGSGLINSPSGRFCTRLANTRVDVAIGC